MLTASNIAAVGLACAAILAGTLAANAKADLAESCIPALSKATAGLMIALNPQPLPPRKLPRSHG